MSVGDGLPTALQMCSAWLARRTARFMILATFKSSGPNNPFARALLLADPDVSENAGNPITQEVMAWLSPAGK
jgi:hypothetical protein